MQFTNDLVIAKTNDAKGTYRLAYRILNGNVLEAAEAFLEVPLLRGEAKDRFDELIGYKFYENHLRNYLTVALHREKLYPLLEKGIIHGDWFNQLFIAIKIISASDETIECALANGSLHPYIDWLEVSSALCESLTPKRRMNKKTKAENLNGMHWAHVEYIREKHLNA